MRYKLRLLSYILIIIKVSLCETIVLRKCCPQGHAIDVVTSECSQLQNNSSTEWKLNPKLTSNLTTDYAISIPGADDIEEGELNIPCSILQSNFLINFQLTDDGDLISHNNSRSIARQFDASEFCLDDISYHDVDVNKPDMTIAATCPCLQETCVHLCCELGEIIELDNNHNAKCVEAPGQWRNWTLEDNSVQEELQQFRKVHGDVPHCEDSEAIRMVIDPEDEDTFNISLTILANGSLFYTELGEEHLIAPPKFCVSVIRNEDVHRVNAIICSELADVSEERLHARVYSALFLVGGVFLLATLVVHALLPELRRAVRGLSLMAHCACMLVAHVALTIIQLEGDVLADVPCNFLAYLVQFSLLAGFFWMNVMCIDLAAAFTPRLSMVPDSSSLMTKFLYYTIYAMGLPLLIFIATVWVDSSDVFPKSVRPSIGVHYCWFDKNSPAILIFFYGPMGVLLVYNSALFVFTSFRIVSIARQASNYTGNDTRRNERNLKRKKYGFVLLLKLFGLMGIPWVMEIVSWAVGGEDYYWYFTDAINILRSIFIFIMFCCKPKVWYLLYTRYPKVMKKITSRPRADFTSSSNTKVEDMAMSTHVPRDHQAAGNDQRL